MFLKNLFKRGEGFILHDLLELFMEKVSMEMNELLTKPFNIEEVSDALFQIGPLKVSGPYGFPARLFQRNWEMLKNDVVKAVLRFFEDGLMPEKLMIWLLCSSLNYL